MTNAISEVYRLWSNLRTSRCTHTRASTDACAHTYTLARSHVYAHANTFCHQTGLVNHLTADVRIMFSEVTQLKRGTIDVHPTAYKHDVSSHIWSVNGLVRCRLCNRLEYSSPQFQTLNSYKDDSSLVTTRDTRVPAAVD